MNIATLDPISLKQVVEINAAPFVIERHETSRIIVYFESEINRRKYLRCATSDIDFLPTCETEAGASQRQNVVART